MRKKKSNIYHWWELKQIQQATDFELTCETSSFIPLQLIVTPLELFDATAHIYSKLLENYFQAILHHENMKGILMCHNTPGFI